jgi:hypothetical protein
MEDPIPVPPNVPAADPGAIVAQVQETVTAAAPASKVTKVIVAVHGVGDQHTYATIQSVVNQFCSFYEEPAAIPLGSFHNDQAAFSMQPPFPPEHFQHLAFAEVYWATIPREVVDDKYTLEEAKKWAGTIVERLRMRWRQSKRAGEAREPDFPLLRQVLEEMIETIAVLERLCFLAAKAGLFTFDLRKLLDAYLGDVQVVAEFGSQRKKILDAFAATMAKVHAAHSDADIFVVAHSEGTVVSFLGLLAAARDPDTSWIQKVRGYMTFGSPLDKHLILWPELFGNAPPAARAEEPIAWRNYYDRGDPIGFALDDVRWWLHHNGWEGVFEFDEEHDIGFIRYPFPGKAHVDYWNDRGVFRHFIRTVVNEPVPEKESAATPAEEPRDIWWKKWLSYVVPYGGVAALFFVAVFILFKAVAGYLGSDALSDDSVGEVLRYVGAIATLLFGLTAVSRIPRLTRRLSWRLGGWGVYLVSLAGFLWLLPAGKQPYRLIEKLVPHAPTGTTRLVASLLVVTLVYLISKRWPEWGIKPLLFTGAACIAVFIGHSVCIHDGPHHGTLWPVFLGAAGFFYLWWLAALILDLVFVWHVYIRQALALQRMDALVGYQARARHAKETKKET